MLSRFRLTFQQTQNRMPHFIAQLMTILMLIEMVFVIILEMFHGWISLNSELLVQVGIDVYVIKSIKSNLTHLHGFKLLVLLPQLIEITFFISTNRINLLKLKFRQTSNHCKRVLEAAKRSYATKTKDSIISQNFALGAFGKLLIVFSTSRFS